MASNYDSVLDQLRRAGLIVDALVVGELTRCLVEGSREKKGWYSLSKITSRSGGTLLVGSYGVWSGSDSGSTRIEVGKDDLSTEQRAALRARIAEDRKRADRDRARRARVAAERAAAAWAKYSRDGESEYLRDKGVRGHDIRYTASGVAVVPVTNAGGVIQGLQLLRSKRQASEQNKPAKQFWPSGVAKQGHFCLLGGVPTTVLLVCEGYATGASLHEATSLPVAVAFDCGNLRSVCEALRKRYKLVKILVCGDDDRWTPDNPGASHASAAALAVGGADLLPSFADEAERERRAAAGQRQTDFNDLHLAEGLQSVGRQVHDRLNALGWSTAPRAQRATSEGGGADAPLRNITSLDELLDRYALVYGQSGTVFDRQEHQLVSLSDMRDACISRELHRAWAEHPERQIVRVSNVGFDPAGEDPDITCNLWAGWPTKPDGEGLGCARLLELLWHMCGDEGNPQDLYLWVIRWLAYPIQHPGAKMKTCLVVHGPQGTGKNMFFEAIMAIYGRYGRIVNQDAVEDRFNDWSSRKLFLIADEVVARSDLYHVKNKLKAFITGDWIRINPKNMAAYDERNHVNLVFLSNETMPVVLEEDDRRHAVIWTPGKLDAAFYGEVKREIDAGGVAALHQFLLQQPLGDFHPATPPPVTKAREDLIVAGKDSIERWYDELIAGEIDGLTALPARTEHAYEAYQLWCRRCGIRTAAPINRFTSVLERKRRVPRGRARYSIGMTQLGPHSILHLGSLTCPEGASALDWLGGCVQRFRNLVAEYKEDSRG